jgi:hypothetical protein
MMGSMLSTQKDEMYQCMVLTIPDFVLQQDIPHIIDWFDYYGIADVGDVDVFKHPEEEYYVEDRPFYGYAVIKINKWYKNNNSLSFYKNLIDGCAKIVYNEEHYWEVEFYEPRTQEEQNTVVKKQEETFNEVTDDNNKYYSEEEYLPAEAQEAKEKMESDEEQDEDDGDDEDYEFEETVQEEDSKYEYVARKHHKMDTRLKTKCKENKSKVNSLNTENLTLEELIVKKNKNYVKRNKQKPFKNEWSRRLRQKLHA